MKRAFVPREKLGKKQKKALDSKKRLLWGFSPVSRRVENKKAYDRKRARVPEDGIRALFAFAGRPGRICPSGGVFAAKM